jgi:hypothetical protein
VNEKLITENIFYCNACNLFQPVGFYCKKQKAKSKKQGLEWLIRCPEPKRRRLDSDSLCISLQKFQFALKKEKNGSLLTFLMLNFH